MTIETKETHTYTGDGMIFNIQRFSLHDGPGIRTLVFLKGCPLRCIWCANPEGLIKKNQVLYNQKKCLKCSACLQCPQQAIYEQDGLFLTDQSKCTGCGECQKMCVYGARTMTNKPVSAQDVVDLCMRDLVFYKHSEGGLTLGGGDPLMQPDFAREILTTAKNKGVHTAIETSGFSSEEDFFSIIDLCDVVFIDLKAIENSLHRQLTGTTNASILRNIRAYDERTKNTGSKLIFRLPLVAGYNTEQDNVRKTGEFILSLQGKYAVEILPFHNFGESKYQQLCIPYTFENKGNMQKSEAVPYLEMLTEMGLSATINTH